MTLTRGYAALVAILATIGVVGQTPWPLLAAVALTLPVGGAAVVLYYGVYGILATVTGATASARPTWFVVLTGVLAVGLLTGAAIGNAALVRRIRRSRAVIR